MKFHTSYIHKLVYRKMSMLPFYFITIVAVFYSVFTYGVYLPAFYNYMRSKGSVTKPNKMLTQSLEELVTAPTVGPLFYQKLITEYVLDNQWEKVLNYSKLAIESPINEHSYSIWYYKATAQCLLLHLEDCQRSARIANSLSPDFIEDSTSQLFNLIKIMKENSNIKLISDKNQIMIVLDSSKQSKKQSAPKKTTQSGSHETQQQARPQKKNKDNKVDNPARGQDRDNQAVVEKIRQVNLAEL